MSTITIKRYHEVTCPRPECTRGKYDANAKLLSRDAFTVQYIVDIDEDGQRTIRDKALPADNNGTGTTNNFLLHSTLPKLHEDHGKASLQWSCPWCHELITVDVPL